MLTDLKVKKTQTKQSQVAEYIREKILAGEFKEGSRLPSTKELSKQWDMPEVTVHRALTILVKEGLMTRKPKMGTVINPLSNQLSTIAIYVKQDLRHPVSEFLMTLISFVEQELQSSNIASRIIMENNEGSALQHLKELAEKRQIQGIIVPVMNQQIYDEINKLPVPFSCISSMKIKNRVPNYNKTFIDKAMEAFKQSGCNKIGLLTSLQDFSNPTGSVEREQHEFHSYFRKKCEENGFEWKKKWIYSPDVEVAGSRDALPSAYDYFAFNGLYKIWSNNDKPEGLLVFTEDLITGTLLAVMDQRINIPEDLTIVFHHNAENHILCPVPCFFVESSIKKMASDLIGIVEEQFYGKEIEQRTQIYMLKRHNENISKGR